MKTWLPALAACLALAGTAAAEPSKTPNVTDTSFATADGARTLQQSVVIDAPAAALWRAFADTGESGRWNAPVAAIDLRVGGVLRRPTIPSTPWVTWTTSRTVSSPSCPSG